MLEIALSHLLKQYPEDSKRLEELILMHYGVEIGKDEINVC